MNRAWETSDAILSISKGRVINKSAPKISARCEVLDLSSGSMRAIGIPRSIFLILEIISGASRYVRPRSMTTKSIFFFLMSLSASVPLAAGDTFPPLLRNNWDSRSLKIPSSEIIKMWESLILFLGYPVLRDGRGGASRRRARLVRPGRMNGTLVYSRGEQTHAKRCVPPASIQGRGIGSLRGDRHLKTLVST